MTPYSELPWKKILIRIGCWWFGHDPKLAIANWEDGKYKCLYVCDCGKRLKIDETSIKIPYLTIRRIFAKRAIQSAEEGR